MCVSDSVERERERLVLRNSKRKERKDEKKEKEAAGLVTYSSCTVANYEHEATSFASVFVTFGVQG